jgi:hypothetical protein
MGFASNIAGQAISGIAGPGGMGQGFLGQIDNSGNLIPGTGGLGNPNAPQPATDMPHTDGTTSPGLGGKGALADISVPSPGQGGSTFGSVPGLGGKGPMAEMPIPSPMENLPSNPTPDYVGVQQGGTPGRPVPAAPFTPRGPGFANPGAPGVVPGDQQNKPLTGNFQPGHPTPQLARPVGRPVTNLSPQPLGRPPVTGTLTKPSKGIGVTYGPLKGAGRGGILK